MSNGRDVRQGSAFNDSIEIRGVQLSERSTQIRYCGIETYLRLNDFRINMCNLRRCAPGQVAVRLISLTGQQFITIKWKTCHSKLHVTKFRAMTIN